MEKCLQRRLLAEFGFNLVDEKREGTIPLFLSIMRAPELMALLILEWNYIPLMRVQAPIDYPLQRDSFVLDAVMKSRR